MATAREDVNTGLIKGLGLVDATTLVMGSMIGSGIFIVSADIARQVQSPGLLLMTWIVTAVLTITARSQLWGAGRGHASRGRAVRLSAGSVRTC